LSSFFLYSIGALISVGLVINAIVVRVLNSLIGGIVYINLTERTDRKANIIKELKKIGCQYERINAIKEENGGLGCVKSQILALEFAKKNEWKNILIFEDDFTFFYNRFWVRYKLMSTLMKLKEWDVLMLAGFLIDHRDTKLYHLKRVIDAQSASGYFINGPFINNLLDVYEESKNNLQQNKAYDKWALDQNWKKIQSENRWFICSPQLGYQKSGYSDIEKRNVDYKKYSIK